MIVGDASVEVFAQADSFCNWGWNVDVSKVGEPGISQVSIKIVITIFCPNMTFIDETLKFGFTSILCAMQIFLCFFRF